MDYGLDNSANVNFSEFNILWFYKNILVLRKCKYLVANGHNISNLLSINTEKDCGGAGNRINGAKCK